MYVNVVNKKQFVLWFPTATEFASLYQNGITPKNVWSYRICALSSMAQYSAFT